MNPNVPQEVRIINAISEQLFNSWPVSIIMIDLEDCIWRLNQQVMNELHLNEYVIGRRITDLLEVVCDKKNVLEDLLLQLRERDVRIIPLDINCFIRELKSGISFLIQGAMVGIHEDGQLTGEGIGLVGILDAILVRGLYSISGMCWKNGHRSIC